MKSTKQLRILISAIALCILLFGVYFLIRLTTKSRPDTDKPDKESAYVLVDRNKVEKVSYFSFTDAESSFAFEKQNGIWRYKENTSLPINTEMMSRYLENCELILAKKLISEKSDDISQYSLNDPNKKLTIVADGVKKSYSFGAIIESKGLCYMLDSLSGSVWLVDLSFVDMLSCELSDFFTLDSHTPVKKDAIQMITIVSSEFSREIIPDGKPDSSATLLSEAVSSIKITEFVDFGRDCFDTFGLSESEAIEMKVITDGKEKRYVFGLGESDEFIYLLVENESGILSEMVYLFSCDNFSHLYSVLSQQ